MSLDEFMEGLKRGVDRGVKQAKKAAEVVEAEAKIFALHRRAGLRAYQLWRAGQLSHPDLQADMEAIAAMEAKIDEASQAEDFQTGVSPAGSSGVPESGVANRSEAPGLCRNCGQTVAAGARFCTHCGATAAP